jgi:regulatory protein
LDDSPGPVRYNTPVAWQSSGNRKERKKPEPLDREGLRTYAGRVLAVRTLTISELRTKLKAKAAVPEDVEEVLQSLKELGFVNDQRFAESFANWRRDNEGFGKTRVVRDLMARRVAPAVAKEAAEAAFEGADEAAMIEQFLGRKYRGKDLGAFLQEEKNLASAFRRLRVAGFGTGNSLKVLKRYAAAGKEAALEDFANAAEAEPDSEAERGD